MMKRILYCLLLTILTGRAVAQTVTVADVEALPGETVSAKLELSAPTDTYTGIQFAIQFPASGYSMATTGAVSGWNGSIEYGSMTDGKVKFAAAASRTFETATVAVEFTVDESLAVGEYDVTVTDIQFEGSGIKTGADDVTFKVQVVTKHTVVLDEESTAVPSAATDVDVTVKRTIKANQWSTICLPFDMTAEQVKEAFGDDVQLAYFIGYDVEKDGENVTSITVNFEDDDLSEGFSANYPYLIKTTKDITEFSLTADIAPDVVQESYSAGKGASKKTGKFIGTYQAKTVVPENSLFISGNKFWYSAGLTEMKAYRAYFTLSDVLSEKDTASARIQISIDETTTGVKGLKNGKMEGLKSCYNLAGQRVATPSKGLYIRDGKKVVVK